MNILTLNTKGGVGKSFISTQILPLAFYDDSKKINVFEVDNNNNSKLNTEYIEFLNLDVNNIDKILLDVEFSDDINIIDAGGGDDTKNVIKSLAEAAVEIDLFVVPLLKDYEVTKNLIDTINLIRHYYHNAKIVVALNRIVNDARSEFIYFFGNEELNVEGVINELDENINIVLINDYNEIDVIKNLHKTTSLDAILKNLDVIENEREYRAKWKQEALQISDDKSVQRAYFSKKIKDTILIKRLITIQQKIKEIFKEVIK